MLIISLTFLTVLTLLILEVKAIGRNVASIETRIHVNGTRGKSSVTEYIAAAMGAEGANGMAKITGVIPTIIENGEKRPIRRFGSPRIQEQFGIIKEAAKKNCKHLVLECMSINPELQKIESRYFKPHIYVITNIRDDHREELGDTATSQVNAICDAIPINSTVITSSAENFNEIHKRAKSRNSKAILSDTQMLGVSKIHIPNEVIPENLLLALTVCKHLQIDQKSALQRILSYETNRQSKLFPLFGNRQTLVLNGFDVNDTASASIFLQHWLKIISEKREIIVIFNTRSDRPFRTDLFSQWIPGIPDLEKVMIAGTQSIRAYRKLVKAGMNVKQLKIIKSQNIKNIKTYFPENSDRKELVLLIGNIAGDGFKILNSLK